MGRSSITISTQSLAQSNQSKVQITAVQKLVGHPKDILTKQYDKRVAGMNIKNGTLEAHSHLAEAEADSYNVQLSHLFAKAELTNLTGK